jgi:hypothetical protein
VAIDKERLKLAVDALRSGEYRQAMNTLVAVDDDGSRRFCCLGVMCDIALKNGIEGLEEYDRIHYLGYREVAEPGYREVAEPGYREVAEPGYREVAEPGYREVVEPWTEYSVLPKPVRDWYGFDGTVPVVMVGEYDHELTYLNDDKGWDFNQIADAIETTYLTGEA